MSEVRFRRVWAMPNKHTFLIEPIKALVFSEIANDPATSWIDPFGGFHSPVTESNDINPECPTKYHMDAREFIKQYDTIDGAVFDPPYSPRQLSESYKLIGRKASEKDTQNAALYAECKDLLAERIRPGGRVICCGWNSNGMGKGRGFQLLEILLVAHGAAYNDTVVTLEVRR